MRNFMGCSRCTGSKKSKLNYLAWTAISCISLVSVSVFNVQPRIILNVSSSVPLGLYGLQRETPYQRGDVVLVRLPEHVRALAAERNYLPANQPALKVVAALPGDNVCSLHRVIWIARKPIANVLEHDRLGRPLPHWQGCVIVLSDQIFLLNAASESSFDGRYFGVSSADDVIGRLVPLWTE